MTKLVELCIMCYADSSIDAPPSFRPAKKYSDLSGLLVNFKTYRCQFLEKSSETVFYF